MGRTVRVGVLNAIEIASPCAADWERMAGDERSRFCADCQLNVYNLSAMTREEAETLIIEKEGRLCARIYRRADGTVLTQDCPVGLRAVRARVAAGVARVGAAALFLLGCAVAFGVGRVPGAARLRTVEPFATVCEWLSPGRPVQGGWVGGIACPPPPPAPPTGGSQ